MDHAPTTIVMAIKQRFARLACHPAEETRFPIGAESAKRLGYDAVALDALPGSATESFAGVGNPFALGDLHPGQVVLDLGCGAGLDSLLAAQRVAPDGLVIGVDMVEEMLEKSRQNAAALGLRNLDFRLGQAAALPVATASVHVVITNGVFNLCVEKPPVVAEMWRVLRPGGHLYMADIFLEESVTPEQLASLGSWSD
ncbi:MAG: methyltransferase domain-containing protein [Candidatus Tectimicrobiota bacterium]